jgi:hypothetical protein
MEEQKETKQFDLLLNESGEFYYKGSMLEIIKAGEQSWQYKILIDGKEVKYVCGVDISLSFGQSPIISLEIIDA